MWDEWWGSATAVRRAVQSVAHWVGEWVVQTVGMRAVRWVDQKAGRTAVNWVAQTVAPKVG